MPSKTCRRVLRCCAALAACGLSGCLASEQTDGGSFTYRNNALTLLILGGVGIALLVFGGGIALESITPMLPRRVRKKKGTVSTGFVPTGKGIGGVVVGFGLLVGGGLMLLLGVPSAWLAFVTVAPDRVVIRDGLFWFAEAPREILYSSIGSIEFKQTEQWTRRGMRTTEYMTISHAGGAERIEMAAVHKAAKEKLDAAFRSSRANPQPNQSGQAIAAGQEDAGGAGAQPGDPQKVAQNPPGAADQPKLKAPVGPKAEGEEGLTPVERIGRFAAGGQAGSQRGTQGFVSGEILQVYAERKIKFRFAADPEKPILASLDEAVVQPTGTALVPQNSPGPGQTVQTGADVPVGAKVLAFFDGGWFPAEVMSLDGKSHVVVQYVGENGRHSVPRSWLRLVEEEDYKPHPRPGAARASAGSPTTNAAGDAVTAMSKINRGDKLKGEFGGQWLPVTVLDVLPNGKIQIHWDGYDDSWDETVDRSKLRFPK